MLLGLKRKTNNRPVDFDEVLSRCDLLIFNIFIDLNTFRCFNFWLFVFYLMLSLSSSLYWLLTQDEQYLTFDDPLLATVPSPRAANIPASVCFPLIWIMLWFLLSCLRLCMFQCPYNPIFPIFLIFLQCYVSYTYHYFKWSLLLDTSTYEWQQVSYMKDNHSKCFGNLLSLFQSFQFQRACPLSWVMSVYKCINSILFGNFIFQLYIHVLLCVHVAMSTLCLFFHFFFRLCSSTGPQHLGKMLSVRTNNELW